MTDLDHLRALIAQLEQDANRCTQPSIEANIREAAATLGVFKEREAALFHGRLPEWDESAAITPEGVMALIAKTEGWTWREAEANPEIAADLIRQLAVALSASLTRPDAALDGRTCSYCFKRPATAVDDDLDAICSECAEPSSRTVETAEECGALPVGTVIRDGHGDAFVRKGGGIEMAGMEGVWGLNWVVYPAVVIAPPVPPTPEEADRG